MHAIRSQARRAAWSTDEGAVNYNPFARTRTRESVDLENQAHRSETRVQTVLEENRRAESRQAESEFPSPTHADTAPPTSATSETAPISALSHGGSKAKPVEANGSRESGATSDATVAPTPQHHGLRDRLRFKNVVRGSDEHAEPEKAATHDMDLEERKKAAFKRHIPFGHQARAVLLGSWVNLLLVAVPVGFAINYTHLNSTATFVVNFIAIIPLAAMLSYATEELALRVGETLGGLLNASFGNAVELIVSIQALIKDEVVITKTSLIGSMLSNLLLVLGMCFFFGGINRIEQFFNVTVAQTAASLLALCIGSLIIPTVFKFVMDNSNDTSDANLQLSRATAVILLIVYGCYLIFQLKTHVAMYNEPSQKVPKRKSSKVAEGGALRATAQVGAGTAAGVGGSVNCNQLLQNEQEAEEEDFEEPQLSIYGALATLAFSTVLVAFCSEFMVDSIDAITASGTPSRTFVGLILLPIVGNAAEHATAVTVACKDKMDLAIGVAVGSSMQIALLVLPLAVIVGWGLDSPCMSLSFDQFQITVLFVAVLLVNYLIQDGKSHWLEGVLLNVSYVLIAVAAWLYPPIVSDPRCTK